MSCLRDIFAYLLIQFAPAILLSNGADLPQYHFMPLTALNIGCQSSQRASQHSVRERSFGGELGAVDPLGVGKKGKYSPTAPGCCIPPGSWLHAPGTALAEMFWVSAGATGTRICPRDSGRIQGLYPPACAAQRGAGMFFAHLECFSPWWTAFSPSDTLKASVLYIYHTKVMYSYHMELTVALQKQFELKWVIFFAFPINLKKPLFSGGEATIQIPFILITYSLGSWPPLSMKVEEKGGKKTTGWV